MIIGAQKFPNHGIAKLLNKTRKIFSNMSKNSNTLPPKGILRNSHSSKKDNSKDKCSLPTCGGSGGTLLDQARARFDEMNILETHHPEGKDYGHMKIEEPKTPYHTYMESADEDALANTKVKRSSVDYNKGSDVDPKVLSKQLLDKQKTPLKSSTKVESGTDDEDTDRSKDFKAKRAAHYGKEYVKPTELPPPSDDEN